MTQGRGIEALAMLTAHGAGLIGGRGGIDRTTAQDVSAALAMARLDAGTELLALAYATQEPSHKHAWRSWWLQRVRLVGAAAWGEREHLTMRFGLMTYVDSLGDSHCGKCNGCGIHTNQKTCAGCDGTGKQAITEDWNASRMELDRSTWSARWQSRYDWATALHATWLDQADRIAKHLRRQPA